MECVTRRRVVLAAVAIACTALAACGGPDAVTVAEIDEAAARWAANEPDTYTWRVEGTVDGFGVLYEVLVADGDRLPLDEGGTDDPVELFDRMRAAIADGVEVRASFDELGYPLDIEIGNAVDLRTTELRSVQPQDGCPSAPAGSPTDVAAEPQAWALFGEYRRWSDAAGCPVRLDVVSDVRGPEHCEWDGITFLTVSLPPGGSIVDVDGALGGITYVWDPDDTLGGLDGVDRSRRVDVTDLPSAVIDTGYRRDDAQLWIDPSDPSSVYVVGGDGAERYVADPDRRVVCA